MKTLLALSLLILSCPAQAKDRFTAEQREARFYYDLGPKEIDVTSYPKAQQENYRTFAKTCSQCHTLARPINSPLVTREDWKRFVRRMHVRTKERPGAAITADAAKAAIDFLAYDSEVRKVKGKADFAALTHKLEALFAEVRLERARVQVEADKKKTREPAPYMGGR
ncbi:MAG: hypothetical protein PHS14_03055 [Elusimicrobia bacterium]|nr:hypothetical protein [Elusimicrobiota bacterium]